MEMSVQLDMSAIERKTPERVVVQDDLIPGDVDDFLHLDGVKPSVPQYIGVMQVVVSKNEMYPARQGVDQPFQFTPTQESEVPQMEDVILCLYGMAPVGHQTEIHLIGIIELAQTACDGPEVPEMCVRSEERMLRVVSPHAKGILASYRVPHPP